MSSYSIVVSILLAVANLVSFTHGLGIQSSYLVPCHLFSFSVACLISCPVASFCHLFSLTELFPFLSPVLSPFLLPVLSPLLLPVFLLSCYLSFFFFTVVYFSSSCYLSSFLLPVFLLYFCPSCFFPVASLISAINGTGNYWVFLKSRAYCIYPNIPIVSEGRKNLISKN